VSGEIYEVDSTRAGHADSTGVYVRARDATGWGSHDIATLTSASLTAWLLSCGDSGEFAASVVLHLLGYSLSDNASAMEAK
jgi:hypothetical protein